MTKELGIGYQRRGSLTQLLEVMKNALFGRLQQPHPYFIEKGVHAVTLVSHTDSKKAVVTEIEMVNSLMKMLEQLVRGND